MKIRAALWIAAVVFLALTAAWLVHRHRRMDALAAIRAGSAAAAPKAIDPSSDAGSPDSIASGKLPAMPSRDLIASDGIRAARLWQARAEAVMFAKRRKELGEDIARLLLLPYDKAWDGLMALAEDGDMKAMLALAQIGSWCQIAANDPVRKLEQPASTTSHDLPAEWKPFIDELGRLEQAERSERYSHCPDVGDPMDLLDLAFDKYFTPDNPDALAEIAADNDDRAQAIADLRDLIAKGARSPAENYLAGMLIRQPDAAQQAEGRATLERLAANDPDVAVYLGSCLANGCDAFAADPDAAQPWLERAAGLTGNLGLVQMMAYLDRRGDATDAWAWSLYNFDLALAGCLETIQPDYRGLAWAVRDEERRRKALHAEQHNAGLAAYYEITGRWEKEARDRLACAD